MNKSIKVLWFIAIILFIFLLCIDFDNQSFVFFNNTNSFASDFFNVCRYICDRNPYNNELDGFQEKIYPPIAYMLMYPYTLVFDYHNQTFATCAQNMVCVLSFLSFTFFCSVLWIISSIKILRKYKVHNVYLTIFLGCVSCVFLYSIERGNYIILSAALCNYFIAYYDSPSKKPIGLFCLALSSGLKVYPVILSLLLIRNKDYKSFFLFAAITSVIVFLPFFFFVGGVDNIPLLIRNVTMQSSHYGALVSEYKVGLFSLFTFVSYLLSIDLSSIANLINISIAGLSLCLALIIKDDKYSILLLLLLIALFPKQAWMYNLMYILPFVFIIANSNRKSLLLFTLLFIILQPFQIVIKGHSLSYLLSNICVLMLWGYAILYSIKQCTNYYSRTNSIQN